jgi:hypothetical protein
MSINNFKIGVIGDTGFDIFTEDLTAFNALEGRRGLSDMSADMKVPSGANLTSLVLSHCVPDSEVFHYSPASANEGTEFSFRYTTMLNFLVDVKKFGLDEPWRCIRWRPLFDDDDIEKDKNAFNDLHVWRPSSNCMPIGIDPENATETDLLVIYDGAGNWRDSNLKRIETQNGKLSSIELIQRLVSKESTNTFPPIIVNVQHDMPNVYRLESRKLGYNDDSGIWNELHKHREKVCVVISANALRREGASISRRLSWEKTIEDMAVEIRLFDKLSILTEFRHLVIRFGLTGALHIYNDGRRHAQLVFAPRPGRDFYRDPSQQGDVFGKNLYLVAALAREAASRIITKDEATTFARALKAGLYAGLCAFDQGYKLPTVKKRSEPGAGYKMLSKLSEKVGGYLNEGSKEPFDPKDRRKTLGVVAIRPDVAGVAGSLVDAQKDRWEILKQTVGQVSIQNHARDAARLNVAVAVTMYGWDEVLNREPDHIQHHKLPIWQILIDPRSNSDDLNTLEPGKKPVWPVELPYDAFQRCEPPVSLIAPVTQIGELTVLERTETESLRSIRNLFKNYVSRCKQENAMPPISVAVFGPPGSGKSFFVKQLADDINADTKVAKNKLIPIEYNVSQFSTVDEIGHAIQRANTINIEGNIPLVFFDEFDSDRNGQELGWLKHFLAPMQDGAFFGTNQTIKINRAIFVFAGGIFERFEQFYIGTDSQSYSEPALSSKDLAKTMKVFKDRKGPDFVSRLRGHIDILPINAEPGNKKPVLRRAIVLRSLLEKRKLLIDRGNLKQSNIDIDIVYALLTVDRYRHGTRSMEAVIEMCVAMGNRMEKASLPSKEQLQMHVDADNFVLRMLISRSRSPQDGLKKPKKQSGNSLLRDIPNETEIVQTRLAPENDRS